MKKVLKSNTDLRIKQLEGSAFGYCLW